MSGHSSCRATPLTTATSLDSVACAPEAQPRPATNVLRQSAVITVCIPICFFFLCSFSRCSAETTAVFAGLVARAHCLDRHGLRGKAQHVAVSNDFRPAKRLEAIFPATLSLFNPTDREGDVMLRRHPRLPATKESLQAFALIRHVAHRHVVHEWQATPSSSMVVSRSLLCPLSKIVSINEHYP